LKSGEAVLGIERRELFQKLGGLGAGPGEGGVDQTELWREGLGLVKLEQPAADRSAMGTDGQEMEELLVLLRRPICGEQALQSGGIEVLVLHAILLSKFLQKKKRSAK
jgi:hypothetical protein